MIPPVFTVSPVTAPDAVPLVELALKVSPRARRSANHVNGAVVGSFATYTDVHGMTWYFGGGLETRNALGGRLSRYSGGIEDVDKRKVQ